MFRTTVQYASFSRFADVKHFVLYESIQPSSCCCIYACLGIFHHIARVIELCIDFVQALYVCSNIYIIFKKQFQSIIPDTECICLCVYFIMMMRSLCTCVQRIERSTKRRISVEQLQSDNIHTSYIEMCVNSNMGFMKIYIHSSFYFLVYYFSSRPRFFSVFDDDYCCRGRGKKC